MTIHSVLSLNLHIKCKLSEISLSSCSPKSTHSFTVLGLRFDQNEGFYNCYAGYTERLYCCISNLC